MDHLALYPLSLPGLFLVFSTLIIAIYTLIVWLSIRVWKTPRAVGPESVRPCRIVRCHRPGPTRYNGPDQWYIASHSQREPSANAVASLSRAFAREIRLEISPQGTTYGKSQTRITVSAGLIPPRLQWREIPYQSPTQPGVSWLQTEIQTRRSGTARVAVGASSFLIPLPTSSPRLLPFRGASHARTMRKVLLAQHLFLMIYLGNGLPLATAREYKYL